MGEPLGGSRRVSGEAEKQQPGGGLLRQGKNMMWGEFKVIWELNEDGHLTCLTDREMTQLTRQF